MYDGIVCLSLSVQMYVGVVCLSWVCRCRLGLCACLSWVCRYMLGLCSCVLCQYFCACVMQACNGYSTTLQVLPNATMRVDVTFSWIVSQSARTTQHNSKNKALRKQVWDTYTSCQLPYKCDYIRLSYSQSYDRRKRVLKRDKEQKRWSQIDYRFMTDE